MGINYAVLGINCYKMFLIAYYQEQQFYGVLNGILGKLTYNNVHTDLSSATARVAVTENTL